MKLLQKLPPLLLLLVVSLIKHCCDLLYAAVHLDLAVADAAAAAAAVATAAVTMQ